VLSYLYEIRFRSTTDEFSLGEYFSYNVTVRRFDGIPAPADFSFTVTVWPLNVNQTLVTNEMGMASSSIFIPLDANITLLSFESFDENVNSRWLRAYLKEKTEVTESPIPSDRFQILVQTQK
jgi:hypothetical protein